MYDLEMIKDFIYLIEQIGFAMQGTSFFLVYQDKFFLNYQYSGDIF